MSDQIEVERKWRLENNWVADWLHGPWQHLSQAYVVTDPGELRVRSDGKLYWMTAKTDGGLQRQEWEVEIPEWVFHQLYSATVWRITKRRCAVQQAGQIWEVDVYGGDLSGLVIVEAEFTERDSQIGLTDVELRRQAMTRELFPGFGPAVEVTEDKRYKNKSLAVHGLPV